MKRSSYMIGIAVIMLAAAFAIPGLFAEDADAGAVDTTKCIYVYGNISIEDAVTTPAEYVLKTFKEVFPTANDTYFIGWSINKSVKLPGSGIDAESEGGIVTAIAVFQTRTVSYQEQVVMEDGSAITGVLSGKPVNTPASVNVGEKITIGTDVVLPDRTGKNFIGWMVDGDESKTILANGSEYTVTESVTFIAVYNGGYEIEFIAGDTSTKTTSLEIRTFTIPVPEKAGHTFAGWYDEAGVMAYKADGTKTSPEYVYTKDTALTAKFVPMNMTVTFIVGEQTTTQTVLYGQPAMAPALPEGYVAWLGADGEEFDFTTPITENITITAKAYVAPEVTVYKMTFIVDTTTVAETDSVAKAIPADPAKTGFEFVGWAVAGNVIDFETYEVAADTIFVAQFKELIYTVTFMDKNENIITTQTVKYGQTATIPVSVYIGWQTKAVEVVPVPEGAPEGTEPTEKVTYTAYDFATPVTGDLVLYGEEETTPVYKVVFDIEGNTTTTDSKVMNVPTAEKKGNTFMGWAVNGEIVDLATYEITADVTFTAVFEPTTLTIQFLDKDGTLVSKQTVKYGEKAVLPKSVYVGWQIKTVTPVDAVLDEDGNVITEATEVITYTDFDFATPITADMILYGEEPVVEPAFYETATGKCLIILAVFVLGFLVYKAASAGKFDAVVAKVKKGGKKE